MSFEGHRGLVTRILIDRSNVGGFLTRGAVFFAKNRPSVVSTKPLHGLPRRPQSAIFNLAFPKVEKNTQLC